MDWAALGFAGVCAVVVAAGVGLYLPVGRALGWRQKVRIEGPSGHLTKEGTVTGAGIVFAIPIGAGAAWLLWREGIGYGIPILAVMGLALVGWLDDWMKVQSGTRGLPARYRFVGQGLIGLMLGIWAYRQFGGLVYLPFGIGPMDLGIWRAGLDIFVVWGLANGVNFTDGLDGLLSGVWALFGFGIIGMSMATGLTNTHPLIWAGIGASIGFLAWNMHPAKAFMGEVGSGMLAGVAAVATIASGLEFGLLIAGFIFAAEVLSVIIQVFAFKTFKRRVFRMSPLHHHFELSGIPEERVTTGFWIAQTGLSLGGIMAYV